MTTVNLDVHHLTRVEGHGNIVVDIQQGKLTRCDLEIIETPRFFEAMLRGRSYDEASRITSRICGICAIGHATASLRATEQALGVTLSQQTKMLRKLNFYGEILDSHILHIYMLVAPDYLGLGSVLPLAHSAPEIVLRALRMKQLAGDLCAVLCGRHTHPVSMTVGGFTDCPAENDLRALHTRLIAARADCDETIQLLQGLTFPNFERETEYVALQQEGEYCFIDGMIASSDGGQWPLVDYRQVTNEKIVQHSSAKHTHNQRDSYMVGALARFNLNYSYLHPRARAAATALGLKPKVINPYLIPAAQAVEVVHCIEESIRLLEQILNLGIRPEDPATPTRYSGEGVGAAEVPRGVLFHHYKIEDEKIIAANCIIPTGQNLANIESDMRALVPTILDRSQSDITHALEMLVRAYDPCISCSTHLLTVKFV